MHVQHATPLVLTFKFYKADPVRFEPRDAIMITGHDIDTADSLAVREKPRVKSFLDPDESTFAQIRKRLSTLSLSTAYNRAMEPPTPPFPLIEEKRLPPRRISSISSRDTFDRASQRVYKRHRASSKTSIRSEEIDTKRTRPLGATRTRASESEARNKLQDNYITPGRNPDLFSKQIRLKEKSHSKGLNTRSTSPKSVRSIDSSGKVHLGLIDSLDLNESLKDVEKLKERYSSDDFVTSLALFKLRGHDKCLHADEHKSYHIRRGTRLLSPIDNFRPDSINTFDSSNYSSMSSIISPRLQTSSFRQRLVDHAGSSPSIHVTVRKTEDDKTKQNSGKTKLRKSVGFDMVPKEFQEDYYADNATVNIDILKSLNKEPKSILKRTGSKESVRTIDTSRTVDTDDEFVANANYRWRFQLPRIYSPVSAMKPKSMTFRKKMFHQGDGVSSEFEQVIGKYGNCRQSSMVRETSQARASPRGSKGDRGDKEDK